MQLKFQEVTRHFFFLRCRAVMKHNTEPCSAGSLQL